MKLSLEVRQSQNLPQTAIVGVYEDLLLTPAAKDIDQAFGNYITKIIKKTGFKGKTSQILPVFALPNADDHQVIIVGCGPKKPISIYDFRNIFFSMLSALDNYKFKQVTDYLTQVDVDDHSLAWKVKQMAEMIGEAFYRFDLFKSKKEPQIALEEYILSIDSASEFNLCEIALGQGQAIANGVTLTRNLGNLPSNICTPSFLAEQAQELAKTYADLNVTVLNEENMRKLKMGGILGVSQGSAEEAKLICLEYYGAGQEAPIALVGKGVTFDTGGNSLKPADNMVGMKYDMCGAATVIGTFNAVLQLKLPINLVGVVPSVENMPGGSAYKPEDILTTMSGQTVEVISTDAEGRVILADALTYCERYEPKVVIDIATLTGAVVIALGFHATGLISNDDHLAKALLDAGIESNDRAWRLPLWEEYQEQIKSPFADMANTGGRPGGAITAACFLSRFTKKFKWAHLDVAGTAAMMMGTTERKATGRPVYLLMQYLIKQANKHVTA